MSFDKEPTGYIKTAISDLQGSWENLRDSVAENFGFHDSDRIMFHIHEGMSWESVRNLDKMHKAIILIQNIANQTKAPDEVIYWISDVHETFNQALIAIKDGRSE